MLREGVSLKFVNKYMRLARQVADDNNPCYSRHIGVVLVRAYPDGSSKVLGTGYNGPPRRTPHCDSRDYLERVVWPQLTPIERCQALQTVGHPDPEFLMRSGGDSPEQFLARAAGCKTCPRKLIGARSGERTELCSCQHAERNAISNAGCDLHGAWAFCWCGVPCFQCTGALVNAGVVQVVCIDWGADYSHGSRYLLERAGVVLHVDKPEAFLQTADA